jgi:hypothetical protein
MRIDKKRQAAGAALIPLLLAFAGAPPNTSTAAATGASFPQPDTTVAAMRLPHAKPAPAALPSCPEPAHDLGASTCPLCEGRLDVPVHTLTVAEAESMGAAYADTNVSRLAHVDSLLQSGAFGAPGSAEARQQAHLLARLLTLNAYSYMVGLGTDRHTVWEANEATLRPAFETFSDPGIIPLARLVRSRMGLGHMCAHYDLSQKLHTQTVIGGRTFDVRVDDVKIDGQKTRALILNLPTSLDDVVEIWITEHVSMDVERVRADGPPAPYEAYVIDHIRGLWVHKAGVHRPEAFVFWVTPRDPHRKTLPETPLVGARIYVPHLRLHLPFILPDIGFEDLRTVDLPQPILEVSYLRGGRYPEWLQAARLRGFKDWEGVGPLPPALRQRFPDL